MTDIIEFGESVKKEDISLIRYSDTHLMISHNNGVDSIVIYDWFESDDFKLSLIRFSDGSFWSSEEIDILVDTPTMGDDVLIGTNSADTIDGLAGNDYLETYDGDDHLNGGSGDDYLEGGLGSDTYYFDQDFGQDGLYDEGGIDDALVFGDQINPDDIVFSSSSQNIQISLKHSTSTLLIYGGMNSIEMVERFLFSDGTVWDGQTIIDQLSGPTEGDDVITGSGSADSINGLAGNDTLYGGDGDDLLLGGNGKDSIYGQNHNDELNGGKGVDKLYGGNGNDILYGGDQKDTLKGEGGNDHLWGGKHNDILIGGRGDDIYHIGRSEGFDKINNSSSGHKTEHDLVSLEGSYDYSDLWFVKNSNHLDAYLLGSNDRFRINNWFKNAKFKVDEIQTSEAAISTEGIDQLVNAMSAFGAPSGGEISLSSEEKQQIDTLIASSWSAS